MKKEHEYDSLKLDMSPLIKALKEKEIEDISLNLKEFRLWLLQKKHTTDVYDKLITDAANKIAKANGYSAVLDSVVSDAFIMWSTPQAEFVNITKDVCTELGIK